jgi:hypothetical protein
MGFFNRLFNTKQAGASDRERAMHSRPESFSIIAIPGDAVPLIPNLLADCKYVPMSGGGFDGRFEELYEILRMATRNEGQHAFVKKAWYLADGHTVLVDPEMVLIVETEHLKQLAKVNGGPVIAAIWERVSETVLLAEVSPAGEIRRSHYLAGESAEGNSNPHPEISAQPDHDGLKAALATYGLTAATFGQVEARVVELRE